VEERFPRTDATSLREKEEIKLRRRGGRRSLEALRSPISMSIWMLEWMIESKSLFQKD